MEYIYTAMLLHKTGQKIDESIVTKVLEAANVKVDPARVKALIAALDGVDIEKAIKETMIAAPAVAAPAQASAEAKVEKKEEKKEEDDKKQDEQAAAGLGALFG